MPELFEYFFFHFLEVFQTIYQRNVKKGIYELNRNLANEYKRKLKKLNNEFKKHVKEIDPSSEDYSKLLVFYKEEKKCLNVENDEKFEQEKQELLETHQKTDDCCICQDKLCCEDSKTNPCGHEFHRNCMIKWLKQKQTCPHCRKACTISDLCKNKFTG